MLCWPEGAAGGLILLDGESSTGNVEFLHQHHRRYSRAGGGGGEAGNRFECEFCHRHYSTKNSLRNHRSIYHREKLQSKTKNYSANIEPSSLID